MGLPHRPDGATPKLTSVVAMAALYLIKLHFV